MPDLILELMFEIPEITSRKILKSFGTVVGASHGKLKVTWEFFKYSTTAFLLGLSSILQKVEKDFINSAFVEDIGNREILASFSNVVS